MNNEPDYDNLFFEEKKMQKTPEVGDVWIVEETNVSFYIEAVEEDVIIALQAVNKMLLHEIIIDTEVLHKH